MTTPARAAALAVLADADQLRLLSVEDAAEATGLTERAFRHLIATRRVPVVRINRAVKIRQADLAAMIEAATTPATGVAA